MSPPRWLRLVTPPALALIALTMAAEAALRLAQTPPWLAPRPSAVFAALWADRAALAAAFLLTAQAAVLAFALSAVAGVGLAVLLSTSRWVQRAFYPYTVFFQTVPVVAIAPLLVIWFGYGLYAVTAAAFVVSVFPVVASTLTGLRSVDPALHDLFRLYGAGFTARLVKLELPSALPGIFTGLRVAAGLAVIGAVVAEIFAGGGLGLTMQAAIREQRPEKVFAVVLAASLLGLGLFGLVSLASHLSLRRWHASAQ